MLRGDEKALEMSRSVLPSTRPRSARREKARLSRGARRGARAQLTSLLHDLEEWEDCPGLEEVSPQDRWRMVSSRRGADKVNPFIRWATEKTRDVPRDLRLAHVRGLLPPGLIGDHARSHLNRDEHFVSTWTVERRRARRFPSSKTRLHPRVDRGLAASLLRQLLHISGGQRALNDFIKRHCATDECRKTGHDGRRHRVFTGPTPPRVLKGVHDVLPFLEDIDSGRKHGTWTGLSSPTPSGEATLTFLRLFHRSRGDLDATLAALPPARPLPVAR